MAVQLNNSDIHLVNSTANAFVSNNAAFTLAGWINGTWNGGGRISMLGIYGPSTPTAGLQIGTNGIGDLACWGWSGGALISSTGMTAYNSTFVHVAYTYDGSTHSLYLNGALVATSTTALAATAQMNMIYINGYPTGGILETGSFQVDDVNYFSRTLTLEQIQTIYNSRGQRHAIVYGSIATFAFEESAQGTTISSVVDLSGNGNHLSSAGAGSSIKYTYSSGTASINLRPVL